MLTWSSSADISQVKQAPSKWQSPQSPETGQNKTLINSLSNSVNCWKLQYSRLPNFTMFTVKNMSSHSKSKCSEARVTWLCHIGTVVGKVKKPKLIQIRMKQILGQFIQIPLHIIIWGNTKCTCTFASYIYMHKYMCLFWNPFIYIYTYHFFVSFNESFTFPDGQQVGDLKQGA